MWSLLAAFVPIILKFFGLGPKDARQVSHDDGVEQGIAQQRAADQAKVIEQQEGVINAERKMDGVQRPDDLEVLNRLKDGTA